VKRLVFDDRSRRATPRWSNTPSSQDRPRARPTKSVNFPRCFCALASYFVGFWLPIAGYANEARAPTTILYHGEARIRLNPNYLPRIYRLAPTCNLLPIRTSVERRRLQLLTYIYAISLLANPSLTSCGWSVHMGRKRENKINKQSARWMGCKFVRGVWPVRINGLAADGFFISFYIFFLYFIFKFRISNFHLQQK
jgi:hypothetical protein